MVLQSPGMGKRAALVFGLCCTALQWMIASSFCPNVPLLSRNVAPLSLPRPGTFQVAPGKRFSTSLRDRLWERLELQEDEEPMWYLLNCVAGLELELLFQCREACKDMEDDVVRFIVPTEKKTRSHGAKRMVTEHKVKYLGYVFAKLRLCKKTYETVQQLDLCRSWMGTVNHKGYRKLPPSPLALSDDEIANFGLEEWEDEDTQDGQLVMGEDGVIVDLAEEGEYKPSVDQDAMKAFLGLRVEDMVKVTARNKFFDEEGVVRRLKDGKIMVRFYTYGTMFEEWLNPSDVRKLTELEALRGLSGPTQPVTQRQLEGPTRGRDYFDAGRNPDFRRQQLGGPQRNRRQDRTANRFSNSYDMAEKQRNDRNWEWYQDQKERKKGRRGDSFTAGSGQDSEWAQGDVDSQWGRGPSSTRGQRRNERTRRENQRVQAAVDGDDDWSAFVSSSTSNSGKDDSDDDFFASLMSDLKKDTAASGDKRNSRPAAFADSSDEDSFFDSLLDDLGEDNPVKSGKARPAKDSDNPQEDFFSDLEAELEGALDEGGSSNTDFFTQIEADIAPPTKNKKQQTPTAPTKDEIPDDFFDSILDDMEEPATSSKTTDSDSFFEDLLQDVDAELSESSTSKPFPTQTNVNDLFDDFDFDDDFEDAAPQKKSPAKAKATIEADLDDSFFDDLLDGTSGEEIPDGLFEPLPAKDEMKADKPAPPKKRSAPPTKTPPVKVEISNSAGSSQLDPGSLTKCTVPVLKDMLRERGLKVSGKKAELIDRLVNQ